MYVRVSGPWKLGEGTKLKIPDHSMIKSRDFLVDFACYLGDRYRIKMKRIVENQWPSQ
jgi:hypothetical protein